MTYPRPQPDPAQAGSSLVELMVMLAAAVIILSAALTGVVQHSAQRRINAERGLALAACRNVLEQLRSVDIAVLPTLDGTGFDVLGPNGETNGLTPLPGDADGLPGEILVRIDKSAGPAVLYRVRATAVWAGVRSGRLSLETLMGERK